MRASALHPTRVRRRRLPRLASSSLARRVTEAAVVLLAIATSVAFGMQLRPPVRDASFGPIRLAVPPPPDSFSFDVERVSFALSPDGSQLGFVATDAGRHASG